MLKFGIPKIALDLNIEDYKNLMGKKSLRFIQEGIVPMTLEEMAHIMNQIKLEKQYPDVYRLSQADLSQIMIDFPTLQTEDDVRRNIDLVRLVYDRQGSYELFQKTIDQPQGSRSYPYQDQYKLNTQEYWLLFWKPWKADGTKRATDKAFEYEREKYGSNGHRDKRDAYRHSIWNVLIAAYTDGNKSDRENWAREYTDAHEYGGVEPSDNSLDRLMDLHNNGVGRSWWNSNASESGWWLWYSISIPDDNAIKNGLFAKSESAQFCTTTAQINNANNILIYIPYTVPFPAP